MDLSQVLFDFFGRRIAERGLYGPIEYLVYGAVMVALAFFVIFPVLDRKGIKFNAKFMLALLPYILFGSSLRVLEDMSILPRSWNPLEYAYYFVTPGIYVFVGLACILCLFASLFASKRLKWDFTRTFAALGLILSLPILIFELLHFRAWAGFLTVLGMAAIISLMLAFLFRKFGSALLKSSLNRLVLLSQLLDGSATFVATQFFFCGEQHPLSGALLDFFPLGFVFAKAALALAIMWYVDKEIKNENLRGFIKVVVAILGFATGLRDLITLGVGTCL